MTKTIPNHPNYAITDNGEVINTKTNKTLAPLDNGTRHLQVILNGKHYLIHRLVADAFLEKPEEWEAMVVHHKDGNPLNNKADNLAWVSQKENCRNSKINKPVVCQETGTQFSSISAAIDWLMENAKFANEKSCRNSLWCHLSGKTKTCGRLHWSYVDSN